MTPLPPFLSATLLWAALLLASLPVQAQSLPDRAFGLWKTQTHEGIVEIAPCGASICGRLITSLKLATEPDLRDTRNAEPGLRTRKLAGLLLLQGFSRTEDGWARGTIYNPDDGRTYQARVTPIDADHLRVRGCVFVPLCQSQLWSRVR